MAKTVEGTSKAQQVRDYIKDNPKLSGGEVQAYFEKKGLTVASSEVSNARRALGLAKRRKGKAARRETEAATPRAPKKAQGGSLSAAVEYVKSVGGLKAAHAALAELEAIKALAN